MVNTHNAPLKQDLNEIWSAQILINRIILTRNDRNQAALVYIFPATWGIDQLKASLLATNWQRSTFSVLLDK